MQTLVRSIRSATLVVGSTLSLWACDAGSKPGAIEGDGAQAFVSHVSGQSSDGNGRGNAADAGTAESAAPGAGADDASEQDGDAARAIAEADIIQVQGDRLFALSSFSGLTVVDLTDKAALRVLGRYRTSATPFEMYLRGDLAYVMFNGFWSYEYDEDSGASEWVSTARMQALDVRDPGHITLLGDHEIAGEVSDSRLVGDVLYLVTFENGWCWGCEQTASTCVASFDVADPARFPQVDELRFASEDNSWGARSISVNSERMYVAGPDWGGGEESTIQVVDVSDPEGKLVLGAEVQVAGLITSRWQMDEYDGVLRVISQGWSTAGRPPIVETFRVQSAGEVAALGSLEMQLPRPEQLQSVRFDGDRAYAITFERTDPLFTLDLSQPVTPRQVGELEIPGFVYHMEPRGDRVYALGFDAQNEDGGMHVSIFDVSNLATPVMLDRVNFGTRWAHAVEDQDRIHKAFNLMLESGAIFVPYAGGDYSEGTCDYHYESGIQIIDVADDDLTLRGTAPQLGTARRSLLHKGVLIGVSDDSVQSFDISDRDAPRLLDRLEVARNVESLHLLGDRVLRFGSDWWTDRSMLDVTTKADANAFETQGELDLQTVSGVETRSCQQTGYWGDQVLVHGETAYVARYTSSWDNSASGSNYEQRATLYVLDISSGTPAIVGSVEIEPVDENGWIGSILLTDKALLVGRGQYRYVRTDLQEGIPEPRFYYDIFSLEDARAPRYVQRYQVPGQIAGRGWGYGVAGCDIDMGWGWWGGGYQTPNTLVDGDLLISQHEEPIDDDTGRVRYYMDRLDVSDPDHPRMFAPVNIPGKVVHFDAAKGIVVTLEDDLRQTTAADYSDCSWRGSRVTYEGFEQNWATGGVPGGTCRIYDRLLNTLRLDGDVATRISRVNLDRERNSQRVAVSDQRVFVLSRDRVAYAGEQPPPLVAIVLDSFAVETDGSLRALGETPLAEQRNYWSWFTLAARGERAFIEDANQLHVVRAPGDAEPTLVSHDMPGFSCNSLQVDSERAWCAMGKQGVLAFDL